MKAASGNREEFLIIRFLGDRDRRYATGAIVFGAGLVVSELDRVDLFQGLSGVGMTLVDLERRAAQDIDLGVEGEMGAENLGFGFDRCAEAAGAVRTGNHGGNGICKDDALKILVIGPASTLVRCDGAGSA